MAGRGRGAVLPAWMQGAQAMAMAAPGGEGPGCATLVCHPAVQAFPATPGLLQWRITRRAAHCCTLRLPAAPRPPAPGVPPLPAAPPPAAGAVDDAAVQHAVLAQQEREAHHTLQTR